MGKTQNKSELNSKLRLLSIFDSHHDCTSQKLISNGRPAKKYIVNDYLSTPDMLTGFDEECRKIKNREKPVNLILDASEKSIVNPTQGSTSTKKYKNKQIMGDKQQLVRTDSGVLDHSAKRQTIASIISQGACSSTVCHTENAAKQAYQHTSGSADIFPHKVDFAAILEAICNQVHQNDSFYSGGTQCEINPQLIQMSAKAFVDQMFLDRKFTNKEGAISESKPFSDALEILNSNKDLFVKLLKDLNSALAKYVKNLQKSQTEKETIRSILDINFSKPEKNNVRSFGKPEWVAEVQKGCVKNPFWEKIGYQPLDSSKGSFTRRCSDKIVVLKPTAKNIRSPENVACHCPSLQSRPSSYGKGSNEKPPYFSLKAMKRKLKSSLRRNRIANSSTIAKIKDDLWKKQNLKSRFNTDISGKNEMVCKNLELSKVNFTEKQESDIVLEAKRHLSVRLKNVTANESPKSQKIPKTLWGILSSPEHDSRPLSPLRDVGYSASEQMRFAPHNNLQMSMESSWKTERERQTISLNPWRPNKQVESGQGNMPNMPDMNSILQQRYTYDPEMPDAFNCTNITCSMQTNDTTELLEEARNSTRLRQDSPSADQIFASALDASPVSPCIYKVDIVDGNKDQEMHSSPVSVLDPYFTEDSSSPQSIVLQTAQQSLHPIRIDFDQYSYEISPRFLPEKLTDTVDKRDSVSAYVQSVLHSSHLCWDDLSAIVRIPEQLRHASLFNKIELLPTGSCCDPKLLLDLMNEVLLEIYQQHISSLPWLSFIKPEIRSVPLEGHILDEVTEKVKSYLLPQLGPITLNLLSRNDVGKSRSWLDLRLDTEDIAVHISENILEESIADMILESKI